ncbi:MAG: NUDIX domain-containing protein [bacterium]|nr:NUDIX domain-containing protein [bacterium]
MPSGSRSSFIRRKGRILFGKRAPKRGHGVWCIPGGHLEAGESFEE